VIRDRKKCRVDDRLSLATGVSKELLHVAAKTVLVDTPWNTALTKLAELE
jgi:hypothetical protein